MNRPLRQWSASRGDHPHLLIGTHYFDTHKGGIEIVAGELARSLVSHEDISVEWMACDAIAPPGDIAGATLTLPCWNGAEQRWGIPFPVPTVRALSRLREAVDRCDGLLLHDALYPTNVAAAFHARRTAKPVVVVQHVGLVPYDSVVLRTLMGLANRVVAAPILRSADQVVFISGQTRDYFSARTAFRREPVTIFNGLRSDLPALAELPSRGEARRTLGLSDERMTVLFVGRFVEKKGLGVIERMARALPEVQWLMCGWGPIDPAQWQLPNVRLLGALDAAGIATAYRAANLLVLPSVGEGLPLVVQEALACGTPVMGSDEMLVADPWLRNRIIALPVVHGDAAMTANAWTRVLAKLLDDGEFPAPCPAETRERYSWQVAAKSYSRLIRQLLNRPG